MTCVSQVNAIFQRFQEERMFLSIFHKFLYRFTQNLLTCKITQVSFHYLFVAKKGGLTAPCWYSGLFHLNLLATSICIETPAIITEYLYCNIFKQLHLLD